MTRAEARAVLAWALPRLSLDARAHRRMLGQIVKRVCRRAETLGGLDEAGYRRLLEREPAEWRRLRALCRVTVSRFYRDAAVFDRLWRSELPELASRALAEGRRELRVWSAGCGAGEEVYTFALIWSVRLDGPSLAERHRELELRVVGSDLDAAQLARARAGVYPAASLRELPRAARDRLEGCRGQYRVPDSLRSGIEWQLADLETAMPRGHFDLVACRNSAFSYFDASLRRRVAERLARALHPGGLVVLGRGERWPEPCGSSESMPARVIAPEA